MGQRDQGKDRRQEKEDELENIWKFGVGNVVKLYAF